MKQKLLLLLTLLCTAIGSAWAENEVLLSYQMDNENYAPQMELTAGNGTIYFGADKREASDYAACGYGYKLDGDMTETSTKYVLMNLTRALAAGDVIKLKMYSTSTPSGSDYGISIFAERATVDPLATLYLSGKKNEEKEMTYTVKENDGIAGLSSIYLARAAGKSTFLTAVEIYVPGADEDPTGDALDEGKTWDFTVTGTTDWENLLADETNWTKANDTRMSNKNTYANAPLIANGQELEATKGLLFNIGGADKLRIDKDQRLCLNGNGLGFTIPGLKKGQKVTITARTASKSGLDRYLSAENLTVTEGEGFDPHDADEWFDNVGTVTEDGDVTIKTNVGGMNLQKIVVTAAEGGGEPAVVIAKPTFEVDGVTYESGATVEGLKTGQRVTINVEEGMYIYTNWSGKTGGSKDTYYVVERMKGQTSYGASTSTGGQRVLYAVAGDTDDASGNSSDLAYIVFTGVTPADPIFTPEGGDVDAGTVVTIETSNGEDKIYYTTDGTVPTSESTLYENGITIEETTTINAIAYDKNNGNPSAVVTETYTVAAVVAPAAPVFSTPDYQGDINNITRENINVYIEVEEGCSVKYTTDGSDPATSQTAKTLSATAISIGRNYVTLIETCTLKAVAVKDGVASEVTEETYTFVTPQEETIPVEITDAGYATVYYALKALVVPEGIEAFIVTEDDITNEFANWGYFANYAASETIPAGEAVILKGEPGTYEFTVDPTNSDWANWDNLLRGYDPEYDFSAITTGPDNVSYKFYMLSTRENEVGLYYGAPDGEAFECAPNKAYLAVPESLANNTKSYIFDHTNGIDAIQNAVAGDAAIYNLQGVRMNTQKLNRGIYIVNGKKVVIK